MDTKNAVEVPEWLQFLAIVIWPMVAVFLVLVIRKPLVGLLQHSALSSVKLPGGVEISLSQLAASAAAAGVAIGKQDDVSAQEKEIAVANIASAFLNSPAPSNFAYSKNILWVDDIPDNNSSLVSAFRALGFEVTEALTTEVALQKVSENRYAVLISDMGRPPDGEAGLTLINSLRIRQIHIPTIIFAANWARIHKGEEEKYGVVKITNEASVVYTTVLNLVGVPTKRPRAIRWDEILREPRA